MPLRGRGKKWLETPVGWATANMLYDRSQYIRPRSWQESLVLLVAKRRQEAEVLRTRVMVQATVAPHYEKGGESLQKAMDDYLSMAVPYAAGQQEKSADQRKKVLEAWAGAGPMSVRPVQPTTSPGQSEFRSRLKARAKKVASEEEARRQGRLRGI